ncbi:hypothetical protein O3M35_005602 [Rhynocoris fuscipes]|uniref:RRM domain-containing protein n=1 Tax=Rhynocoris fuscipes TaxID=488301 RepID=A0AAW1DPQ4_9HEMI
MVRKSTKANSAEKPSRKRRGTRRRKESSSESEPETNTPVVEETVSSIALPREVKKDEEVEVESSSSSSSKTRSRRVSKRNAKDGNAEENEGALDGNEWNEDASFWTGADSSAAVSNQDTNEDEGTTWKIQSSNGSGGEIQKLKICRQRPTDSTGSSSPAKECASPRIKIMPIAAEVPEKVENDNAELELDAPMDIVDVESEKVVNEQQIVTETSNNSEETVTVEPSSVVPTISSSTSEQMVKEVQQEEEVIIPGLDLVTDDQQKPDHLWISSTSEAITDVSMIEMPPSKEETVDQIKNLELVEDIPSGLISSSVVQEVESVETRIDDESSIPMETSDSVNITEILNSEEAVETSTSVQEEMVTEGIEDKETTEPSTTTALSSCTASKEENSATLEETITTTIEEETFPSSNSATAVTPSPPPSDSMADSNKCLSLSVSSELAMEQIAKKLNERAARGKESLEESKEKLSNKSSNSRENSPENDRNIEEGEIVSSAAATPDPQPTKSATQKSTVVVRPKEVFCLPTKLKRNIEENPPEERKARVSKKRLCLSPQISITSDLLKALDATADPVSVEELEYNESDGEEKKENENLINNEDIKREKVDTNKCVDVEITVSSDGREVKKKKPIVIDRKSPGKSVKTPPGPKLPNQENHKAARKISIVSADAKALRKSPSPSKKKATEVLFITNLVRPFTVPQLRELLARTGTIAQNGFYIDKIKSKCYVKYTDVEMAIETRHALHGVRWPVNNPKTLRVDFASPSDMAIVQKLADEEAASVAKKQDNDATTTPAGTASAAIAASGGGWLNEQAALKPTRRVTATVREWDMGKVVGEETSTNKTSPPPVDSKKKTEEEWNRKKEKPSRSEKERDRRRAHSPEHKPEIPKKLKKKDSDAPARLLDDLFRKTKATPCIYWLPLTAAQIAVKEEMRRQHMAEHKRRLAELRKTDTGSRRDNKERDRDRDSDRRKK